MAHQHEKDESTELQLPETLSLTLTLCVNNCGLYGNPSTNNMCSSCFRSKLRGPCVPGSVSGRSELRADKARPAEAVVEERSAWELTGSVAVKRKVSRCLKCRKRVGLMGFKCRCGDLFCGDHRYSDRHECGYDYKAVGRDRIERENPLVRAAKIVRI